MIVANSSEHVRADTDSSLTTRRTAHFGEMAQALKQF